MKEKQTQRILDYMKRFGSITSLDAVKNLGVMRLASRICDLKKEGYEIIYTIEKGKNRYGDITYFKRYMLAEDYLIKKNETHIS